MGFFTTKKDIRKQAEALGFTVTEVERELPTLDGGGQLNSLEKGTCMRYALPRSGKGASWSLLLRDRQYTQLPNCYQLVADNITPQLLDACRPVVTDFDCEYVEFEGTPSEVAAFWDEDGGLDALARIHRALLTLQEIG